MMMRRWIPGALAVLMAGVAAEPGTGSAVAQVQEQKGDPELC